MKFSTTLFLGVIFLTASQPTFSQSFFFGNDLSYVNEMQDCGVIYKENGTAKDPFQMFADNGHNLVRLRLWHTPKWYDALNSGKRYSDLADVRRSILRAKTTGAQVLLDFHLSDNWADPSKQIVPKAWEPVVNNLPVLKDSLYNYVFKTLISLDSDGLLPEMVQIGNETNRGILLSPTANAAGWSLDWNRNSQLFKIAIKAVRDVEIQTGKKVKVALHIAGPADAGWLMDGFWANGVTDFDMIGMSYYWAWHKPTTIAQTGAIIAQLRQKYPGKEVMIFETGYIWTLQSNDSAGNIISETHPDYAPATPENQQKWMIDLTKEVIARGGNGVIYWESAWVSSTCFTQWGKGSHQEHATFFNFQNNVLPAGGMYWPKHDFGLVGASNPTDFTRKMQVVNDSASGRLQLIFNGLSPINQNLQVQFFTTDGQLLSAQNFSKPENPSQPIQFLLPENCPPGIHFLAVFERGNLWAVEKVLIK